MIKAIIFDADGMIVHGTRFSDRLASEHKISTDLTSLFFKGDFQLCVVGKADLKEKLNNHISLWGWKKSVDELLVYWFDPQHSVIDERFYPIFEKLKEKGLKIYLATNNEKYRADDFVTKRGLGKYFDKVFASGLVGSKKPETEFFQHIINETGMTKEELIFWDDDPENTDGAISFGLPTELYTDFDSFKQKIAALL